MTIGATGKDDSLLIDVDMKGKTINRKTGTWHTGSTGKGSLKTMTFRPSRESKKFKVKAGQHYLYIGEREDGILVSEFMIKKGADKCRFTVACPRTFGCSSNEISSIIGHDSGIAHGMAIKHVTAKTPYVEFPDRCKKGQKTPCSKSNFGRGYMKYRFKCAKARSGVSFKVKKVANSGTSDSLLIDVNINRHVFQLKRGKQQTWHTGQGGNLKKNQWKLSRESPKFKVKKGWNWVYIGEREDGMRFSHVAFARNYGCKFTKECSHTQAGYNPGAGFVNNCQDAKKGKDKCYGHVNWAMTKGIKSNPQWYPGLTAKSSFADFQCLLSQPGNHHGKVGKDCEGFLPCTKSGPKGMCQAVKQQCKVASRTGGKQSRKCWGHVNWAMTKGIKSNPKWYPGLTAKSSFADFQCQLSHPGATHGKKGGDCYGFIPCAKSGSRGQCQAAQERCVSARISAVAGQNDNAAKGQVIHNYKATVPHIKFPNGKGGNFKSGHIKYHFTCTAAATVSFQAMTIGATGKDDSLLIDVDMKGKTINRKTGTWHTGSTGKGSLKTMTFRPSRESKKFNVEAGQHYLYIGEREDGILVSEFMIKKGAGKCRFTVACPRTNGCRSNKIGAIEGHDSGIAHGMAIKHVTAKTPYVEFPDRCKKGQKTSCSKSNFGRGYLEYKFSCSKATTASFKVLKVANSGTSDSLLIDVNIKNRKRTFSLKKGKQQTWHTGQGGNLKKNQWKLSRESPKFKVKKGINRVYIGEREDGMRFSHVVLARGSNVCKFVKRCTGQSKPGSCTPSRATAKCPSYCSNYKRSAAGKYATPEVTQTSYGTNGATFQLSVTLKGNARNLYSVHGTELGALTLPPAYQSSKSPAVGGPNPLYGQRDDSFVTVGLSHVDRKQIAATPNMPAWNSKVAMNSKDTAFFWMDPKAGPKAGKKILVAQVTIAVPCSKLWSATMGLTGYLRNGKAWRDDKVVFAWSKFKAGCKAPAATKKCPSYCSNFKKSKSGQYVTPKVTQTGFGSNGATFELTATLKGAARNLYSIHGTDTGALILPPAYQSPKSPAVGGPNPLYRQGDDSYITVGLKNVDKKQIARTPNFPAWNSRRGVESNNAAIFWMNPSAGPRKGKPIVVAQITVPVPCSKSWSAVMGLTGYLNNGKAWRDDSVVFAWSKFTMSGKKCPADVEYKKGPGVVNVEDLLVILSAFGSKCPSQVSCEVDIETKRSPGEITVEDLLAVLSAFGMPCGN